MAGETLRHVTLSTPDKQTLLSFIQGEGKRFADLNNLRNLGECIESVLNMERKEDWLV